VSFLSKLKNSLKTLIKSSDNNTFLWRELEDTLIEADFGVALAEELVLSVKEAIKKNSPEDAIINLLKSQIKNIIAPCTSKLEINKSQACLVMVGVNGSGKTTTLAKVSHYFMEQGKSVAIAACDTFRASAVEQLEYWSSKIGCEFFKGAPKADPASVAFRAASTSKANLILVDTSGRLATNVNLMNELSKISNVLRKINEGFPTEVVLVLDSTIGQNSIEQVKKFSKYIKITAVFLSKFDGNAKCGTIVNISRQFNIKIIGVGTGEKETSMACFSPDLFAEKLFAQSTQ
jgi:fused signal recognition particle receptor